MSNKRIFDVLQGGLIVSCQTSAPLNGPEIIGPMAEAVVAAGAVGVRVNGPADVSAVRARVKVPVIGINKQRSPDFAVYITPTLASALEVIEAGADIVAIDGTTAPRPTGIELGELIQQIQHRGAIVMADISTLDEGRIAAEKGADIISSTLSGYTPQSPKLEGPDLDLVEALVRETGLPVIAEGRYSTPDEVQAAFNRGAFAVVVGRAITEPQLITQRFVQATPRHASGE